MQALVFIIDSSETPLFLHSDPQKRSQRTATMDSYNEEQARYPLTRKISGGEANI